MHNLSKVIPDVSKCVSNESLGEGRGVV